MWLKNLYKKSWNKAATRYLNEFFIGGQGWAITVILLMSGIALIAYEFWLLCTSSN